MFPYQSRYSVSELFVALIEQSSGVFDPEHWAENKPYYLKEDVEAIYEEFRDEIDTAITAVESLPELRH